MSSEHGQAPAPLEELRTYTPEQVVEQFLPSASPDGLRKGAQRGKYAHHRIGRNNQVVFTPSDIRQILAATAVEPTQPTEAPTSTPAPAPATPRSGGRRAAAAPAHESITARPGGPRRLESVPGSV